MTSSGSMSHRRSSRTPRAMPVRRFRDEAIEKMLDWAANELEGFTRN